uniref:60S acidic ribosomal protein P2 n=1 Tax=Aureoumbra lagunensis TaxID=44058 RepID=A0A7S3JN07_9STRA|mmetsp:Transcript_11037/g.15222  ORF Transcript_11037/g.15222 Transcript_11037/m.15222 type:complete len:123 (-) Transcript_11037:146-514(-)
MKHVTAYTLLVLGGKAQPTVEDLKEVLSSVDSEADEAQLSALLGDLEGKDIASLIDSGLEKIKDIPIGGGGGGGGGGGAVAAAGDGAAAADEEKKEEEEEEEEIDMGGGMDMFGDGEGGDDY